MTLTFIVPIRHQSTVSDWGGVKNTLSETMQSIAGQRNDDWRCVLVANRGADLPPATDKFEVLRVDFEPAVLPPKEVDREAFYQTVRWDKGRRVLAGILEARPVGHVMVLDHDDLVSNRLAETVADNPEANGWFIQTGFKYDGGRLLQKLDQFHECCGSCFIVRADLLKVPDRLDLAEAENVQRIFGSHKYLKKELEKLGAPLIPLPFPGALYRVGTGQNTSGAHADPVIRSAINLKTLRRPKRLLKNLASFRLLTLAIRSEFFGGREGNPLPAQARRR